MKTNKLIGYFGVREFTTNRLKNEDESIRFTTIFAPSELPNELAARARKFTNKNNEERFAVDFKLTTTARWFNKFGKPCAKPVNADIDGVKHEVVIEFKDVVAKEKYDKEKKRYNPDGFYINAIMFNPIVENPFEGNAFEVEPTVETPPPATEPTGEPNNAANGEEGELPF